MMRRLEALDAEQREERALARQKFLSARHSALSCGSRVLAELAAKQLADLDRRLAHAADKILAAAAATVASSLGVEGACGPEHYDAALVLAWGPVIDGWTTERAPEIASWEVLAEKAGEVERAILDELRGAVSAAVADALAAVGEPRVRPEAERDGMLELDARAADYVSRMGAPGSALRRHAEERAQDIRRGARGRLEEPAQTSVPGWPTPPPWARWRNGLALARILAATIWEGELRAAVDARRANEPNQPATLPLIVVKDQARVLLARRNSVRTRDAEGGQVAEIVTSEGDRLAETPVLGAAAVARAARGVEVFRSYLGHRVLRALPWEVWRRHVAGERDARALRFRGVAGFLDWLEASSKHHAEALAILRAGQSFHRVWGDNGRPTREVGGLWSYDLDERAAPGRHASLDLSVNRCLAPFLVRELERGDDRTLVPLVPLPDTAGISPTLWAPEAALQLAAVVELVESRLDVARYGGALLDWSRLAASVGLGGKALERTRGRWLSGGEGAVFEEVEPGRFHLADNAKYGPSRRYIDQTARWSLRQSEAGKRKLKRR